MTITQEQFNNIINLLGQAANAAAAYQAKEKAGVHDFVLKDEAQEALTCYIDTVAQLYQPSSYPAVYLDAFNDKQDNYHSFTIDKNNRTHNHHLAKTELTYLIYVGDITKQLNDDFSPEHNKLSYTGDFKYVTYARETIQSETATFHKDMIEHHEETLTPSFMMLVLSHPATPIVGAILFLAGIAACTTGMLNLGIALASVGGIMMAGYGFNKLGFFSENTDPAPPSGPFAATGCEPMQP